MNNEQYYKTLSNAELNEIIITRKEEYEAYIQASRELYRRQQIKEQKNNHYQIQIKIFTIIILILTFLALVVGIVQLFK